MVYSSLFQPYNFLIYSFLLILTLPMNLAPMYLPSSLCYFIKFPSLFFSSNWICCVCGLPFVLVIFVNFDLIYMLVMVFRINCISSMKTNSFIHFLKDLFSNMCRSHKYQWDQNLSIQNHDNEHHSTKNGDRKLIKYKKKVM